MKRKQNSTRHSTRAIGYARVSPTDQELRLQPAHAGVTIFVDGHV
jgi:hypothetical protein